MWMRDDGPEPEGLFLIFGLVLGIIIGVMIRHSIDQD